MAGDLLPNLGLPSLTIFLASEAKSIGAFGLVGGGFTILYHASILGLTRGHIAFTNHYRRDQGLTTELDIVAGRQHQVAGWVQWA